MVHVFISSRSFRLGNPGVVLGSVAAHAGLIALAVASPRQPIPTAAAFARALVEHVTYALTAPLVDRVADAAMGRGRRRTVAHRRHAQPVRDPYADLASLQLSFVADIPESGTMADFDFGAVVRHALVFTDSAGGDIAGTVLGRGVPHPDADGAYTEDLVEKAVMPYDNNPRPRYPMALLEGRVEDAFDVLFVVDSTGRVDEHTIRIPGRVERLLVDAVRYALKRSRYFPAELAGRRVPQLVEQRFIFRIQDR